MRRVDGHYECALCGAILDIAEDEAPLVTVVAAGGKPNQRVISVRGIEVHACPANAKPAT